MAKTNHKKKMKKMGRSRMRRAVMGTLSAILMISAIIVALVPIPESRADSDPTDLIAAATANRTHTYLLIRIREIIRYMPAVTAISELLTEVTAAP